MGRSAHEDVWVSAHPLGEWSSSHLAYRRIAHPREHLSPENSGPWSLFTTFQSVDALWCEPVVRGTVGQWPIDDRHY